MRQIGWYDPQSCSFFNGDKDDGAHAMYSEPVYVDETPAVKDDDIHRDIITQVLENQCTFMIAALRNDNLDNELRMHYIRERKKTIEILRKT